MRILRSGMILAALALVMGAMGQSWMRSYEAGIRDARAGRWDAARSAFQQAAANRPEDVSTPTILPGPPTEQRKWRKGSPYSPNYLAAYSAYREAVASSDPAVQNPLLQTAAAELETLLAKGENSRDAYFFLDLIYARLNDQTKRQALEQRLQRVGGKTNWKVDESVVAPEEIAAMGVGNGAMVPGGVLTPGSSTTAPVVHAGAATTGETGAIVNPIVPGLALGGVAVAPNKFALIIGQTDGPDGLPYASEDAQRVRQALINDAGYAPQNIQLVLNGTAAQITATAKALASRVPDSGTVLVYYAGSGVDINGKDYLEGVDAQSQTDTSSMVGKTDLYQVFMNRGARLFAFFEVSRPIVNGFFFGQEVPMVGAIAQTEATIPDGQVTAQIQDGRSVGLYAKSFASVLTELRSNQIPITEFGWQVFYKMKRGNTGTTGGSSYQIPTLPVLTNLAADARF